MTKVIGVRFRRAGKVYFFSPGKLEIRHGDNVIVETARGVEFGSVVTGPREVEEERISQPLKSVIRIANRDDYRREEKPREKEKEAFSICQEKIRKHGLEMKLIDAEYTFDNNKVLFYFTADGRIDFRELVKDLASVFRTRIELRQIGVRDETKIRGGLGICGRELCCHTYLTEFAPVSIKMAKEQNLSLNPTKISGLCGRLMCCLKYEQDCYSQTLKKLPKVGKDIVTPDGVGVLAEINAIRERVKVRIKIDDDFDVREYAIDEVRKPGPDDSAAVREAPKPKQRRPEPEAEAPAEEQGKRRKYPHQKAPKNLSTDQFLEKLKTDGDAGRKKGERPKKERPPRERRRGKGAPSAETAALQPPADAQTAGGTAEAPAPQPSAPSVSAPAVETPAPAAPAAPASAPAPEAEAN